MIIRACFAAIAAITFVLALHPSPAAAQATRTWVSGVGDDANPCSRTAPCKTFAGAISKTATNGEINCLDPGGFGAVTIVKSISIVCDYTEGGILSAGTTGVIINGSGIIVTLKGLDIEGIGTGIHGINIVSAASVHVHKCQIRSVRGGGSGISFTPSANSELFVADSYITDNGNTTANGGIFVKPTGAANVIVTVNRTQIENNSVGIRLDASATSGLLRGAVRDSLVAGNNNDGISATGATVRFFVNNSAVVGNGGTGLVAQNSAVMFVSSTIVNANGAGLFTSGAGELLTAKNNVVDMGAFTSTFGPQ